MGLGCLNPGKCNCGICWDCSIPTSYTINCPDACFDQLNGVHATSEADFTGDPECVSTVELPTTELYLWEYNNPVWNWTPFSSMRSGDGLHVSRCDGSSLDQTVNPQPASPFLFSNLNPGNVLYRAERTIQLISPATVRITLWFAVGRQVLIQHDPTNAPPGQFFYSRDRDYEFVFEAALASCAGQALSPISTTVGTSWSKGWGLGNPDADLGALSTVASDFTVSLQMP